MKYKLTEHHDILPGVRKRRGTIVLNLPPERVQEGIKEGWLEPIEYGAMPDKYPRRDLLVSNGFYSIEAVERASDNELLAIDGIGPKTLQEIRTYNTKNTE